MDLVLGVSMAPNSVRMVLVEGEGANGVIVDQDEFSVEGEAVPVAAADRVIEAILGTRESAAEGGDRLKSTGVTWTGPMEAAALRDALAAPKVENVVLITAFEAAAALAQAVGSATRCPRTALLFVEPTSATLAVVDSSDGSVAQVRREPLPRGDDVALARLAAMVSGAKPSSDRPDGLFLVGAGVDVRLIKPTLEAATSFPVTTPEEPELALARGAALASANALLGAPVTVAMPQAGELSAGARELAYSAEADDDTGAALGEYRDPSTTPGERRDRKPVLAVVGATAVFVVGVVALALAMAFDIRPHAEQRPDISKNVVRPLTEAPPPKVQPPQPKPETPLTTMPAGVPPPPSQAPPTNAPGPVTDRPLRPRDDDRGRDWLRRHLWGRGA